MFRKNLSVFATIFFWVLFSGTNIYAQETEAVEVLSVEEFKQCIDIDGVQLVDIRTPAEFAEEKIERAVNIDFLAPNFSQRLNALRKDEAVYLYCHSGGRSSQAAKILKRLGFNKVYDLRGGIVAWMKQ